MKCFLFGVAFALFLSRIPARSLATPLERILPPPRDEACKFSDDIAAFYISMESTPDRRGWMAYHLRNCRGVQRITAVDGNSLTQHMTSGKTLARLPRAFQYVYLKIAAFWRGATLPEVGLCFSHMNAILSAYRQNAQWSITLEDDAASYIAGLHFRPLKSVLEAAKAKFKELTMIQLFDLRLPVMKNYDSWFKDGIYVTPDYLRSGTTGVVWSRQGMEKEMRRFGFTDFEMEKSGTTHLWTCPNLCVFDQWKDQDARPATQPAWLTPRFAQLLTGIRKAESSNLRYWYDDLVLDQIRGAVAHFETMHFSAAYLANQAAGGKNQTPNDYAVWMEAVVAASPGDPRNAFDRVVQHLKLFTTYWQRGFWRINVLNE